MTSFENLFHITLELADLILTRNIGEGSRNYCQHRQKNSPYYRVVSILQGWIDQNIIYYSGGLGAFIIFFYQDFTN